MASLVADYGDSGDSEGEEDNNPVVIQPAEEGQTEPCVNFFGGDDEVSSEDSDTNTAESSDKTEAAHSADTTPKLPNPFLHSSKLPSPHLKSKKKKKKQSPVLVAEASSVFVNPFAQAEQAKLGILEKHVRLTEAAPQKPASKQVCFKFKKGKCFLGDKCRYFHDRSNIALGPASSQAGNSPSADTQQDSGAAFGRGDSGFKFPGFGRGERGQGGGAEEQFYHPAAHFSQGQPVDLRTMDEDSYMAGAKGKRRHGVTDYLVPPKKALSGLEDLRKKERPWTMKK